jgi:uncharacterized protein YbjT (DUF2867 family)
MITISGATGNVGRNLVERLRESGEDVRAMICPGQVAPWDSEDGLEIVEATFGDMTSLERALRDADGYFLMCPPDERQVFWQRNQVNAAAAAGVRRVVKLSAYDTSADSKWNMGRWHWDGELALRESGLPHAILRPQYFQENLLRATAALGAGKLATFIPSDRRVGAVHAADVADVAARLLTSADLSGQIVVPTGPKAITTAEVASAAGAALGVTVTVDYRDPAQARTDLESRPRWLVEDLINICQYCSDEINDAVPYYTGHAARDIGTVAAQVLAR